MISILGLGPGSIESLTLGAVEILKKANKVYLRTEKHPTVAFLRSSNIEFTTFDDRYESYNSFDEVYESIAHTLIEEYKLCGDIVYAVPGHPLVAEKSVGLLIELCSEQKIPYEIKPAVSFIDSIMESLRIDPIEGIKIIDAFDLANQLPDRRTGIIITQMYNKLISTEVKLWLLKFYEDDAKVFFVRAAGVSEMETIREIPIYELDRQEDIDYLTSVYIPKNCGKKKDFYNLLQIMDTLRGDNGCPWDKEQTHESLKRYIIEESYEVVDAIENDDEDGIIEELGDVLFQIIFHARLGQEEGYFDINDVINGVCDKMILRHPHVFGNVEANTSNEVSVNWDKIKKEEKGFETYTEELKHVAKSLPALIRAEKIQKKASKVGFDWDKVEDAADKVLEELNEVKDVYKGNNMAKITEEVGDLIFAVVNVARFLDIDPEFALNYTIDKFVNRFEYIEETALSKGLHIEEMSLGEMDALWSQAKIFCTKNKKS